MSIRMIAHQLVMEVVVYDQTQQANVNATKSRRSIHTVMMDAVTKLNKPLYQLHRTKIL